MKGAHSNWKNLPVEVLLKIFQEVSGSYSSNEARSCALVCKSWSIPAQAVLYSNAKIRNLKQLRRFYNILQQYPQLGNKVKRLKFYIDFFRISRRGAEAAKAEIFDLLTKLLCTCLPNLEELEDNSLRSYIPILNALQDSQLKHLNKLESPKLNMEKIEVANYATCALFLRDRLEQLQISEKFEFKEGVSTNQLYSDRLYSKLHEFVKLVELNINKKTNDEIQEVEYILNNCKSLKTLTFNLEPLDNEAAALSRNSDTSVAEISTLNPTLDVTKLECVVNVTSDYKLLLYIMHKLPKLRHFCIGMSRNSPARVDHNIFTQLLNYSTEIDTFSAYHFRVDRTTISDTIGDYWKSLSKPLGNVGLKIIYSEKCSEEDACVLDISHKSNGSDICFKYPASNFRQYVNFLQRNGKVIDSLWYKFEYFDQTLYGDGEVDEDFLNHVFTYCPKLRKLTMEDCVLKQLTQSSLDLSKKLSVDELELSKCALYPGVLDQLSLVLPRIELLRLNLIIHRIIEGEPNDMKVSLKDPDLQIVMPYTKIDTIIFEEFSYDQSMCIKVFAVTSGKYYYYRYNEDEVTESSQQEYTDEDDDLHIYICCKTKPELELNGF